MGRLMIFGGLLFAAYIVLSDNRTVRISGGSGGGGFSTYSGAASPAISGIADAAG